MQRRWLGLIALALPAILGAQRAGPVRPDRGPAPA